MVSPRPFRDVHRPETAFHVWEGSLFLRTPEALRATISFTSSPRHVAAHRGTFTGTQVAGVRALVRGLRPNGSERGGDAYAVGRLDRWRHELLVAARGGHSIRVTFVTQGADDDPANAGKQSTGFFTFDSGLFAPGGGLVENSAGLGVLSLGFSWGGIDWNGSTANLHALRSDATGRLVDWWIGGNPAEGGIQTLPFTYDDFWVTTLSEVRPSTFSYTFSTQPPGTDFVSRGTLLRWSAQPSAPIPEPATLLLTGLGLATIMVRRMRQRG